MRAFNGFLREGTKQHTWHEGLSCLRNRIPARSGHGRRLLRAMIMLFLGCGVVAVLSSSLSSSIYSKIKHSALSNGPRKPYLCFGVPRTSSGSHFYVKYLVAERTEPRIFTENNGGGRPRLSVLSPSGIRKYWESCCDCKVHKVLEPVARGASTPTLDIFFVQCHCFRWAYG